VPKLFVQRSQDGGRTWSLPMRITIQGYPPHICRLQDERLLSRVTYRWESMGIRLVLSEDHRSWDVPSRRPTGCG
jgi:hypothetical protein